MTLTPEMLSAYLDYELSPEDMARVEEALATDPELAAEFAALKAADDLARAEFADALDDPLSDALVAAIRDAEPAVPANSPRAPRWRGALSAVAATVALVAVGLGGFYAGQTQAPTQIVQARGWLDDIADYHRVYASQKRHLVEVPATETPHIETWLTNTVGAPIRVPDLSASGLEFQGARLLVAVGKPVAQLMYLDADGRVVALCAIRTDTPQTALATRSLQGFDMVTWGGPGANFVLVGDGGRGDLQALARQIGQDI